MGRELRRVPLDFDWPHGKVWTGFLNPHFVPCPAEATNQCIGGYTPAGKWLDSVSRLIGLIGQQAVAEPHKDELRARGSSFPHPYLEEWSQAPRVDMPREVVAAIRELEPYDARVRAHLAYVREHPPRLLSFGTELVALTSGLAKGKRIDSMAGSEVSWEIAKTLREAAGVDDDWGTCRVCDGHAQDPASQEAYDAWKETPPPTGEGFQLWETTSEGSPSSPVFATLDELCAWCADNATTFGSSKASAAQWRTMLNDGHVFHAEGNMVFV